MPPLRNCFLTLPFFLAAVLVHMAVRAIAHAIAQNFGVYIPCAVYFPAFGDTADNLGSGRVVRMRALSPLHFTAHRRSVQRGGCCLTLSARME